MQGEWHLKIDLHWIIVWHCLSSPLFIFRRGVGYSGSHCSRCKAPIPDNIRFQIDLLRGNQ